jgi:hypothetical protein
VSVATTNALDENTLKGNIVYCEVPAAKEQLAVGWDYMQNTHFLVLLRAARDLKFVIHEWPLPRELMDNH